MKFSSPVKKIFFLVILLFLLASCKTVDYVTYRLNLTDTIEPVLLTKPETPEINDKCSSLADVMENSLKWQTAYYNMEDYAGALEDLITEIVKSVQ